MAMEASGHSQPSCIPSSEDIHRTKSLAESDHGASDAAEAAERPLSPEPNCPICLGKLQNKSFTDGCFHTFCFTCLLEWSKVKAECPLCKQVFKSIIHNVRSIEDYDQYYVNARLLETSSWQSSDGRRFRYPTTLTAERRRHLALERMLEFSNARSSEFNPCLHLRDVAHPQTSTFRRRVYEEGLWVRPLGDGTVTRYRDTSPEFFHQNPACTHRLVPWLNRELNVLLQNSESQVSFVLELILALITRYNILGPEFHEHIQPYLQDRTRHFVHEFYNFARSPHNIVVYDQICIYEPLDVSAATSERIASPENYFALSDLPAATDEVIDLSPTLLDDSVIFVPDTENFRSRRLKVERQRQQRRSSIHPRHLSVYTSSILVPRRKSKRLASTSRMVLDLVRETAINQPSTSSMTMDLDNSLPGPSRISSSAGAATATISSISSDSESDCMVVGYVKPRNERTPELVDLVSSSDSEGNRALDLSMQKKTLQRKSRRFLNTRSMQRRKSRSRSSCSSSSATPRSPNVLGLLPPKSTSKSKSKSPPAGKYGSAKHRTQRRRSRSWSSCSSSSTVSYSSEMLSLFPSMSTSKSPPARKSSSDKHQTQFRDSRSGSKHGSSSRSRSSHSKSVHPKSNSEREHALSCSPEGRKDKSHKKHSRKSSHKLRSVIANFPREKTKENGHLSSHKHHKHKKHKKHHH